MSNVIDLVNKHGGAEKEDVSVVLDWNRILNDANDDLPEVRAVLKNRPVFSAFAFAVYRCFNVFCRVFMMLEVKGLDHIKDLKKPYLICPNHQSFLDPFVLTSNYPFDVFRNTFHVGASEFFEGPILRFVAKMVNVVPINPDTELMRAMKAGAIGLKHGKVLNIYPEGERAFDGELHKFKKGAAILASELDLPIVPVALDGLHKVWARHSWKIRPAKVKIHIGKPFYAKEIGAESSLPGLNDPERSTALATSNDEQYEAVTAHLKDTIASMIDEMRR